MKPKQGYPDNPSATTKGVVVKELRKHGSYQYGNYVYQGGPVILTSHI